ncbi:MAG: hypothetical protein EOP22_10365 [Hyphomicrobiales bacterium]|nr:MAG: hypothetical protein EOP22_10365 [Hyphomicrobiales bacterium]
MLAKSIRVVLVLLAVLALTSIALVLVVPVATNEIAARALTSQNLQMPHPSGTERIAVSYGVHKWSNSDNCDFAYLEARSYDAKDRDTISRFYGRLDPIGSLGSRIHPNFEAWETYAPTDQSTVHRDFAKELEGAAGTLYYTLEGYDQLGIDLRCM